jgi:hypothetical protein
VRFWAHYHETWLGGIEPNSIAGPVGRDGGWGYIAGLRFKLASDEALLVSRTTGGARYIGFQLCNLWMISPDARRFQSSLNLAQACPDVDGSYTYLISATDPGTANWIDSAGLNEGFALLRWQVMPPGADKDDLVRDFRVIKLTDVTSLIGVAKISREERAAQLLVRDAEYASRATI